MKQSKKYLAKKKEAKAKKKEANKRQLAMAGLCVGWKVCWWQLAMAGLCGVVEWAMEDACVHLVSTSGVLDFAREAAMGLSSVSGPPCFGLCSCFARFFKNHKK